jgi:prevent-host-death family protein
MNIYDAKAQLSKLIGLVESGHKVTIAKAGRPVADLVPHETGGNKVKYGLLKGKIQYKPSDFVGLDQDIQRLFYGMSK